MNALNFRPIKYQMYFQTFIRNSVAIFTLIFFTAGIPSGMAQQIPLYQFTFGNGQLTNYGSVGGTGSAATSSTSATVQITEDATWGGGGYSAVFPLYNGGLNGPAVILPSSTNNLQLLGPNDSLTVSAWIKWNGPNGQSTVGRIASDLRTSTGWAFSVKNNGLLVFDYYTATGGNNRTSTASIPQGVWTHVACTWTNNNSSGLAFYINGAPAGISQSYTGRGPLTNAGQPIVLGADSQSFYYALNGSLGDVRLYNTALDPAGIAQVYQIKATGERYVFAHYMVCEPTAGTQATVEDYENEIQQAQARGIDGFALNCGGWTQVPTYKSRALLIYQAAQTLGTNFKLFVSADLAGGNLLNSEIIDMVETFRNHPNQLHRNGKPVFSTFGSGTAGSQAFTQFIEGQFQGASAIYFVPFYYPSPATETPTLAAIQQVYQQNSAADGFFYFGAAPSPSQIVTYTQEMATTWHAGNKLFMAPVSPYYRGLKGNYRVFEGDGFQGMSLEWQNAIQCADWVEITTWNDWNESTYLSPFGSPTANNGAYGSYLSHTGYLDASQYYIQWFKLGYPPKINKDIVYYFYRLHSKNVIGNPDPGASTTGTGALLNVSGLDDNIFATVLLTDTAQLTVSISGTQQQFNLVAGLNNVSIPLINGQPEFVLKRNGTTIIDKVGEQTISPDTVGWANFQYFSSSSDANSDLPPPDPDPFYQFTFANSQLTNLGSSGSSAQSCSPNGTTVVQVGADPTLGSGEFSATFPMTTGGQQGPFLLLPNSGWVLQLLRGNDALTISTWIKWNGPNGQSDGRQFIASNMSSSLNAGWAFSVRSNGLLEFDYFTATGGNSRTSTISIPQGVWTHVACTWQNNHSSALAFYINGAPVGINQSYTGLGPLTNSGKWIVVGTDSQDTYGLPVNASLSDVRLYGQALDQSAITNIYNY